MSGVPLIDEKPPAQIIRERRVHIAHLQAELERIVQRRRILDELEEKYEADLKASLAAEERRAQLGPQLPEEVAEADGHVSNGFEKFTPEVVRSARQTVARAQLPEEVFRNRVVDVGCFTIPELAAMLEVPAGIVKERVLEWLDSGKLKSIGKFAQHMMYEYVPPQEPGAAFKAQQATRPSERPEQLAHHGGLDTGGIPNGQAAMLSRLEKVVRVQARKAVRAGWEITELASGHGFALTNGEARITLSHSPRNAGGEAMRIIEAMRKSSNGKRGEPVPNTGRPIGPSGKVNLDRKRGLAGKKVLSKKGKH